MVRAVLNEFSCFILCRIKRKENSSCSACRHPLQELTHLLLNCPASEPLRCVIFGTTSSIFDLWSRRWGVAGLLGLLMGSGSHHNHSNQTTSLSNRIKYPNEKGSYTGKLIQWKTFDVFWFKCLILASNPALSNRGKEF